MNTETNKITTPVKTEAIKKTPTKAVAKKEVRPAVKAKFAKATKIVEKNAAKKAPAKPKSDYKAGARVKILAIGRGKEYKGFVTKVYQTPTGPFISVNIGDKKNPVIKDFRPARVRGY